MVLKADITDIVGRLLFILLFVYLVVVIEESVSKFQQEESTDARVNCSRETKLIHFRWLAQPQILKIQNWLGTPQSVSVQFACWILTIIRR